MLLYHPEFCYCSIAATLILLVMYFMKRNYNMRSNIIFFLMLIDNLLASALNITTFYVISFPERFPLWICYLSNETYLFVYNMMAVLFLLYIDSKTKIGSIKKLVKFIAAAAFFFFSLTSLLQEEEEEEENASRFSFSPLAVFTTFFVAELGDKTQLAAITFGATNGLNSDAILIWLSASIGLFAADIIGLLIGYFLHGKTPDWFFKTLAFIIFAAFGFCSLPEGIRMLNEAKNLSVPVMIPLVIAAVIFAGAVAFIIFCQRLAKKHQ